MIEQYLPKARREHAPAQILSLAADPPRALRAQPRFTQLAAAVYAYGLPESRRVDGAAGCAHELKLMLSKSKKRSR